MRVEAEAIRHILSEYPDLHPTPPGNKGFDLYGTDDNGQQNRWVEVKALKKMLGTVGMFKVQFKMAQQKGFQYWLYIVENATSDEPQF
jgi:hypothetical protein